jgi:hypothetical protein
MLKREDIRIRDPFVLTDAENGIYYVYGTTELKEGLRAGNKFSVYVSKDLENFEGPITVFDGEKCGFWGTRDFWAAEVHKYKDKYYLFGSFYADNHVRASQILMSDSPLGEFKPISLQPQTVGDWDCLDGTLYVEGGVPYLVFCHEWTQCNIGEIWAVELASDLTKPVGEPFLLFKASDNQYVGSISPGEIKMVTDGPFLFKENGYLKMIWSSFASGKYVVLEAVADNLRGAWSHRVPRFDFDGGHAMIFTALDGKQYFSLHAPNTSPNERMKFIEYKRQG